ncbi:hypothetical protein BRYFOR_09906 [Marvinbryantia formatexigens DSM 14469]|uniref:Uncharacterized protein n=1 Tax=Marvinbryantia formatexigens DSM 14469 TaxID=478749 RepID=C6LMK5_9FIRM|nr:hypothetical protein [Marvinbryantia formatexigens]EET58134.1 hypothetical protein BRYFOR_09906 [Marvinbryantia formatexigens DSM 14469]UWO23928.1 hypothetical protein NQ534_15995 [Marvinbryantia formatexigens DSM 14469]SDH11473.1 hypothetical protein SAMN05660368_03868 [Marvinbryantia formatexigens]
MKRVAEIIYIVPEKREEYLQKWLNPDTEMQQILWVHGIRNQYYFKLNEFIMMTFEYVGGNFREDMNAIAAYPEIDSLLVKKRRKDVPEEERTTTDWWAPVKKLGSILTESPMPEDKEEELSLTEQYHEMLSGSMEPGSMKYDISYDDDDWSESVHI